MKDHDQAFPGRLPGDPVLELDLAVTVAGSSVMVDAPAGTPGNGFAGASDNGSGAASGNGAAGPSSDVAGGQTAGLPSAFVRAVAHDLRSPLAMIMGVGETLADRNDQLEASVRVEFARSIVRQGQRMQAMIDNLLAVDRLSVGRARANLRQTDVAALVADVVRGVDHERVAVHMRLDPVVAWVDRVLLERVVENLVRNAVEQERDGEPVELELQQVEGVAGRFRLRVLDRGPGVPVDVRETIFQAYHHGDRRGVGLSIVAAFTALHGGSVDLEDRPGGGSVFTVTLPVDGPDVDGAGPD